MLAETASLILEERKQAKRPAKYLEGVFHLPGWAQRHAEVTLIQSK